MLSNSLISKRSILNACLLLKRDTIKNSYFQCCLRCLHMNFPLREFKKHGQQNENLETKPFKNAEEDTWIGPPNELSNLRLKVFPKSEKTSEGERHFYTKSEEIQNWNQKYWENHNKDFQESRKVYIEKVSKEKNLPKDEPLSVEDMSNFYKYFLDKNHKKHVAYNWNWYKKNFFLLFLAAKANFSKLKRILKN